MLSIAAGDGATPVFGNGAGVGSGTFSAYAVAGLTVLSPHINATITIAGPSLAKPLPAISLSRHCAQSMHPNDASLSTRATNIKHARD